MNVNNQRIFITGGTGFVGSHLTHALLQQGHQVAVVLKEGDNLDVSGLTGLPGLTDFVYDGRCESLLQAVQGFCPDVVVHLAALTLREHQAGMISDLIASNVLFGTHLLESLTQCGVRAFVNTSSYWQYQPDQGPGNLYAATKNAFLEILKFYVYRHPLSVINLVLYDNYGPGDRRGKLFGMLKNHNPCQPLKMTPGQQKINLLHISDVVRAYVQAIRLVKQDWQPSMTDYFVRNTTEITLRELVERYLASVHLPLQIDWGGIPYPPWQVMQPFQGGKVLTGWAPQCSLDEGLGTLEAPCA